MPRPSQPRTGGAPYSEADRISCLSRPDKGGKRADGYVPFDGRKIWQQSSTL